jgi:hypothetical protein
MHGAREHGRQRSDRRRPTGTTTQNGLVNVNVSDVIVQVPIAAAVNICDVNAAVLAALSTVGGASCDATANSHANH